MGTLLQPFYTRWRRYWFCHEATVSIVAVRIALGLGAWWLQALVEQQLMPFLTSWMGLLIAIAKGSSLLIIIGLFTQASLCVNVCANLGLAYLAASGEDRLTFSELPPGALLIIVEIALLFSSASCGLSVDRTLNACGMRTDFIRPSKASADCFWPLLLGQWAIMIVVLLQLQTPAGTGKLLAQGSVFLACVFVKHPLLRAAFGGVGLWGALGWTQPTTDWLPEAFLYTLFIDWDVLTSHLKRFFKPARDRWALMVFYDGPCAFCNRSIRILTSLDWLGLLSYQTLQSLTPEQLPPGSTLTDWQAQMAIRDATGTLQIGFKSYVLLASRLPALWPLVAVLHAGSPICRFRNGCETIYKFIAARRYKISLQATCDLPYRPTLAEEHRRSAIINLGIVVYLSALSWWLL